MTLISVQGQLYPSTKWTVWYHEHLGANMASIQE